MPAGLNARILGSLIAVAVTAAVSQSASAQGGQEATARILSPVPAGGTSDVVARLLADALRRVTGLKFIVEDRPGGSGRVAVNALTQAKPDGRTLLLAPIIVPVIGPLTLRNPGYDPVKDLVPVSQVSRYQFALAVAADHPARTLAEFVRWARENPQQAMYGTPALGSLPHFLGESLRQSAAIELAHVAYGGVGQLGTDLIGGRVAAGISSIPDLLPLHRAGRLRVLATSGTARSVHLPHVPTFREQGQPAIRAVGWHGVFAPAGTPPELAQQLSSGIADSLRRAEARDKFHVLGLEPTGTTPRELAEIIAADTAYWAPIVKATGFVAE